MPIRTSQTFIEGKSIIVPNAKFFGELISQKNKEKVAKTISSKRIINSIGKTLFQIICPDCKLKLNFSKPSNFVKHQKRFHFERFEIINREVSKELESDANINNIGLIKKKKHPKNINKDILLKTRQTGKIYWIESVNGAGEKIFKGVCPKCYQFFAFPRTRDGMYRHLWVKHQIGSPPKETNSFVSNDYFYQNQEEIDNFKAERIFYVDAAQSIKSNEGKVFWKTSLVENNREVLGWANSKAKWANEAEAYAILKTIFYLVENKITSRVLIYSDNTCCVSYMKNSWRVPNTNEPSFNKYIYLAKKLILKNNLQVLFSWIRGKENPADYYSRLPYKTHNSRNYTSHKIEVSLKH